MPEPATLVVAAQQRRGALGQVRVVARWLRPASAMAAGLAVAAVGFGILTTTASLGLAAVVAGSAVFGLGLAPVTNLVVGTVLGSAPPERAGAASGLSETSTEFGGALGIAILGSIGMAVYRYQVTEHIPRGIPGAAARAISGTLGDATSAAAHLPGQAAAEVLSSARAAFTSGLSIVAGISAVIVAALAVVPAARLRRVSPPDGAAQAQPGPSRRALHPGRIHRLRPRLLTSHQHTVEAMRDPPSAQAGLRPLAGVACKPTGTIR